MRLSSFFLTLIFHLFNMSKIKPENIKYNTCKDVHDAHLYINTVCIMHLEVPNFSLQKVSMYKNNKGLWYHANKANGKWPRHTMTTVRQVFNALVPQVMCANLNRVSSYQTKHLSLNSLRSVKTHQIPFIPTLLPNLFFMKCHQNLAVIAKCRLYGFPSVHCIVVIMW